MWQVVLLLLQGHTEGGKIDVYKVEVATPADMMYVVQCDSEERCDEVLVEIDKMHTERSEEQANSAHFSSVTIRFFAIENNDWKLLCISLLAGVVLGFFCDKGGSLLFAN